MIHLSHNHINRTLCGLDSLKVKTMRVIDYLRPLIISRKELDRVVCKRCVRHARRQTMRAA